MTTSSFSGRSSTSSFMRRSSTGASAACSNPACTAQGSVSYLHSNVLRCLGAMCTMSQYHMSNSLAMQKASAMHTSQDDQALMQQTRQPPTDVVAHLAWLQHRHAWHPGVCAHLQCLDLLQAGLGIPKALQEVIQVAVSLLIQDGHQALKVGCTGTEEARL